MKMSVYNILSYQKASKILGEFVNSYVEAHPPAKHGMLDPRMQEVVAAANQIERLVHDLCQSEITVKG